MPITNNIFSVSTSKHSSIEEWIINSGATDHTTSSLSLFTSNTPVTNFFVKLPKDLTLPVSHIGVIHISQDLTLTLVLSVPQFTFNLLSVQKLISTIDYCFVFLNHQCFIQALRSWKMIGLAEHRDGLYPWHVLHLHQLSIMFHPCLPHLLNYGIIAWGIYPLLDSNNFYNLIRGFLLLPILFVILLCGQIKAFVFSLEYYK